MSEIHYLGLLDVSERIRRRELTSEALTRALLERIDRHERSLNSILMLLVDSALEQARQSDAEIEAGFWRGPLHGVPIGIKDLLWTKGLPTTGGMEILKDFLPEEDATVVARLKRAGAVLIAKLHTTEGALFDHHSAFPRPSNPWGSDHWTGVSSSGSGVATAAGFCFGAIGTDTAGSIRIPSSANSVTGIKPTWGRVSRHGLIHLCESFDHVGPMARSAADAAAMLQAIAGADPRDPTALTDGVPAYLGPVGEGIGDLVIGIDWEYTTDRIAPEIVEAIRSATAVFEKLGARVCEIGTPWQVGNSWMAGMPMLSAELAVAHAEHFPQHADRYGQRARALIEIGRSMSGEDVARALQARDRVRGEVNSAFRDVDLILTPGLGKILPTWEEVNAIIDDPAELLPVLLRFIIPFNIAGVPTISLPGGFTDDGLPIGIQLIGPALGEPDLIRAGVAFQRATDFHTRHPILD